MNDCRTRRCEQLGKLVQQAHIVSRSSPPLRFFPSLPFHSISRWPNLCSPLFLVPLTRQPSRVQLQRDFSLPCPLAHEEIYKKKRQRRQDLSMRRLSFWTFLQLSGVSTFLPLWLEDRFQGVKISYNRYYSCNLIGLLPTFHLDSKAPFTWSRRFH